MCLAEGPLVPFVGREGRATRPRSNLFGEEDPSNNDFCSLISFPRRGATARFPAYVVLDCDLGHPGLLDPHRAAICLRFQKTGTGVHHASVARRKSKWRLSVVVYSDGMSHGSHLFLRNLSVVQGCPGAKRTAQPSKHLDREDEMRGDQPQDLLLDFWLEEKFATT